MSTQEIRRQASSGMIGREYTCVYPPAAWKRSGFRTMVRVIVRWGKGGGPRNVAVEELGSGRRWVRPFRGLRRIDTPARSALKPLLLLVLGFVLTGCPARHIPTPSRGALDIHPWSGIADNCQRAGGKVCCGAPYFKAEHSLSIEHYSAALDFSRRFDLCEDRRSLERDSCDSRISDCRMKLEDPWRSPWLWGVICLVGGTALGAGLGAGLAK